MTKVTTAAWIAHNLGIGASFGGQLFGKFALNPKLNVLDSESDRGKLLNAAWNRYNVVNAISFGTAALTWFAGRTRISGRSIDDDARTLTLVKDGLFVAGAAAGLASMLSGPTLARQAPEGAVPIESGTRPGPRTSDEAATLLRRVNVLGNVNIAIIGAIGAVTTILSQKAGKSTRWSAVARFLP